MGARIPSALIPSTEKSVFSWKKLVFRLIGASVFWLPLAIFLSTFSFGTKDVTLSSEEYLWVGYLSAYYCNVNRSRLSPEQGNAVLEQLISANKLTDSVVRNKVLREVAVLNSTTFNKQCQPSRNDGDKGIDEIYSRLLSRKT